MNIIIAHGYAHRLLRNGLVQSAPVQGFPEVGKRQGINVHESEWETRAPEQMDITGGDAEAIRIQLENLSIIFPTMERRLALPVKPQPEGADSMDVRG
jgi:hypothetical protein